jgi:hypothetical protein
MKEETKKVMDVLRKIPPGAMGVFVGEIMVFLKDIPFDVALYALEMFKESINRPLPGKTKTAEEVELNREIAKEIEKHILSLTDDEFNYVFSKEASEELLEKYDNKIKNIFGVNDVAKKGKKILN